MEDNVLKEANTLKARIEAKKHVIDKLEYIYEMKSASVNFVGRDHGNMCTVNLTNKEIGDSVIRTIIGCILALKQQELKRLKKEFEEL